LTKDNRGNRANVGAAPLWTLTKGNRRGEAVNGEDAASERSLRELRLTALLGDMIGAGGRVKTAERLGVSYRTLVRAVESGRLTGRMSDALERAVQSGAGPAAARERERNDALERRVGVLEGNLPSSLGELRTAAGEIKALREEQAKALKQVKRRLAALESRLGEPGAPSQGAPDGEPETERRAAPWRSYPELVTQEPEPGEEAVYGAAAPLIVEWRQAWRELVEAEDRLGRAVADERLLELELVLIEEHELTLPPAEYPWDWADRRREVWSRTQALKDVRVERARAQLRLWLRRVLTLGLWRK